jgi:hypothetical protein
MYIERQLERTTSETPFCFVLPSTGAPKFAFTGNEDVAPLFDGPLAALDAPVAAGRQE